MILPISAVLAQLPILIPTQKDQISKVPQLTMSGTVVRYSTDRAGNLVVADGNGTLTKIDSSAKVLYTNSPERPATPTSIEAWPTLRITVFYREFQEYRIFDRLMTNSDVQKVPSNIEYARALTPAADDHLWVVDDGDFALKKVNPTTGQVSILQPLPLVLTEAAADVTFLKEYQNQLLLLTKSGTLVVFDNMGNIRKKIVVPAGLERVDTWGSNIYWATSTGIAGQDLYTSKAWELPIPNIKVGSFAVLSGKGLWLIEGKQLQRLGLQ